MDIKNIESYGYINFYKDQVKILNMKEQNLIPARVVEVHRDKYKIVTNFGENFAKLKGSLFYNEKQDTTYPVVGDFALVKKNPYGEDIIYKVLDRKSKFSRMNSFNEKEQVVASNFDYVFIMTSLNHDFNIKRIERYLTIAYESGAIPVITLTKVDLCSDYRQYEEQLENVAIECPMIKVSSVTRQGFDELRDYVKPLKTIVFLGSSGVGKSSLVNAIAECNIMKVNEIRKDDSRGRHTTTHRQLIMLENGAMIIDTPGMRELGMWAVADGLNSTFSEIEELESRCKFRDCSHKSEPGCAIKEALEKGEISIERWENYRKLKRESKRAEEKRCENITSNERRINSLLLSRSLGKEQSKFRKKLNSFRKK